VAGHQQNVQQRRAGSWRVGHFVQPHLELWCFRHELGHQSGNKKELIFEEMFKDEKFGMESGTCKLDKTARLRWD
jgi:hypothetical protein